MRKPLIVLAILGMSCGPAFSAPPASPGYAYYQYVVAVPTRPLAPTEQLHLVWEPRPAPGVASGVSDLQLCVALFGPWMTVEELKTAMATAGSRPSCPPNGAIISTETLHTTSNSGARLATDLVVPSATGFYDVRQISINVEGGAASSATSADGIIEIRKR